MNLANRFNFLLHIALALSVLAFVIADDKPLLALIAVSATLASWILSRFRKSDAELALPRVAINIMVLAAIINAAVRASGNTLNEEFVSTLGQFLVYVMVIKLADRRAPRDDAQLVTLSVFIAIASVLTSNSFIVGIVLMFFVPLVVACAMMWQLRAGQVMLAVAAHENAPAHSLSKPSPAARSADPTFATGRNPRRAFVGVCLSSVIAAAAIATAVFLFVPRGIGNNFLGRFGMAQQAQIGFRESVRLGESGFLSENPTPVMDIRVTTATGEALGGQSELLYFRGASRDQYNAAERVWEDSGTGPGHAGRNSDRVFGQNRWTPEWSTEFFPQSGSPSARAAYSRLQKVTFRAEYMSGNMFCMWRPVSMTPDREVQVTSSRTDGAMRLTSSPGPAFSYTVESSTADELCRPPKPPTAFQSGPIHDLATRILVETRSGANSPARTSRQSITTLRDYLRANYFYTLEMVAPAEGVDPIEFFLFDRKKGHCEYFASAMAALCQSVGIPCRVVTGYLATEFNSLTGQYLVRESNAHAWDEVFVTLDPETGRGRWETFDASPPGEIERIHRPESSVLARIRSWYEALEFGWSNSVIGFDNSSIQRKRTVEAVLNENSLLAARISSFVDRIAKWVKAVRAHPSLIPTWVRLSPLLLIALVACWLFLRRMRFGFGAQRDRNRARAALGLSPFRPSGYYAKALRTLEKAGLAKPDHTPPASFATTLQARSPEAADAFLAIAHAFYRARFSGRTIAPAENAAADDLVRRLQAALKRPRS